VTVWVLQIGEPLPLEPGKQRLRSTLLNEALNRRGHTILWWSSAFDHAEKRWLARSNTTMPLAPGYQARLLTGIGYRRNVSLSRYVDHRLLARQLSGEMRQRQAPDIFIIGMPDYHLASVAVSYCRELGIPCIVDIRDQWPDLLVDRLPSWSRAAATWLLREDFQKVRSLLAGADSLVAMSEDLLEWGLGLAGRVRRDSDVSYPLGSESDDRGIVPDGYLPELAGRFVVTYVGSFGDLNQPEAMLDAARVLQDREHAGDRPLFVLAGDGPHRARLEKAAATLSNVRFLGWLDPGCVSALLSKSSVAVLPWHSSRPAFPNKAVTYLESGLPILNEAPGQLTDLLTEYGAGLSSQPLKAEWLADRVIHLQANGEIRRTMSRQARRLWVDHLDRAKVYARFADHVEAVARPSGPRLIPIVSETTAVVTPS
jgi:glycosyltransferase involved in cell wall biosynthesis